MPKTDCKVLFIILVFLSVSSGIVNAEQSKDTNWSELKTAYFGERNIQKANPEFLQLTAPKRAEDAAIVPIRILSNHMPTADDYIQQLHLFIDNNPMPYSAKFRLSPNLGKVDIATRVRVDRYTPVRIIAEMNDGRLFMVSDFIKASGGCSAPAGKDQSAALDRLGKMQIRMRPVTLGEATPVQLIVSHPNNSGLQMDQFTRGYIPPHFIENIAIKFNDKPLIQLESTISISEDPSIRFTFTPQKTGKLAVLVTDSKGSVFESEKNF